MKQARKRPEMFPKEKVNTIFSNIEDIFKFATELLNQLEQSVNHSQPHLSELGQCFLDKVCLPYTLISCIYLYPSLTAAS